MNVTFHNVTIRLDAETPEQTYDDLCTRLKLVDGARGGDVLAWETDTYSVGGGEERSTEELWAK